MTPSLIQLVMTLSGKHYGVGRLSLCPRRLCRQQRHLVIYLKSESGFIRGVRRPLTLGDDMKQSSIESFLVAGSLRTENSQEDFVHYLKSVSTTQQIFDPTWDGLYVASADRSQWVNQSSIESFLLAVSLLKREFTIFSSGSLTSGPVFSLAWKSRELSITKMVESLVTFGAWIRAIN